MMEHILESVMLTSAGIGIVAAAVIYVRKYARVMKRFKPVLSLDQEAARVQKQIVAEKAEATQEIANAQKLADEITRKAKQKNAELNQRYDEAKGIHDRLHKEIGMLQGVTDNLSFGLYKPQYTHESSVQYRAAREKIWEQKKIFIQTGKAAIFPTPLQPDETPESKSALEKQVRLMLRAFNGESDAAVAQVNWTNVATMEARIKKSFEAINSLGGVVKSGITTNYLNLCLAELRLAYEEKKKQHQEQEEARVASEQMREEERVVKECERVRQESAAQVSWAEQALAAAKVEVRSTTGERQLVVQRTILELDQKLAAARARQDQAVAVAENLRMGFVYVLSNIGALGPDVVKIGMTRRMNPLEHIQELGAQSVPFPYDVHAVVFSKDAPALEKSLQQHLAAKRINMADEHCGFFRVSLEEVEAYLATACAGVAFNRNVEARQYRESEVARQKASGEAAEFPPPRYPEKLIVEEQKQPG
jgi:FtsZ-binding cell division protein ZapB